MSGTVKRNALGLTDAEVRCLLALKKHGYLVTVTKSYLHPSDPETKYGPQSIRNMVSLGYVRTMLEQDKKSGRMNKRAELTEEGEKACHKHTV